MSEVDSPQEHVAESHVDQQEGQQESRVEQQEGQQRESQKESQQESQQEYGDYVWMAKTTQIQTFRKLIEAIQSILRDAHIEISEEGLTLRDVDPLHNCCIEIKLDSFEEHFAFQKFVIAVDLQQLHTCLRNGSGELLILSILKDEPNCMCIEFVNMAKEKKVRYLVPLRKIVAQVLSISVQDMPRVVQMPNNDFQRLIREIAPVAKSKLLYIRSESNFLAMGTKYDTFSVEVDVHPKPNGMIWVANDVTMEPETFTNFYYIRYLERFCKNQLDQTVRISLGRDRPMILQYPVGHLGVLYFYLGAVAPEDVEKLSSSMQNPNQKPPPVTNFTSDTPTSSSATPATPTAPARRRRTTASQMKQSAATTKKVSTKRGARKSKAKDGEGEGEGERDERGERGKRVEDVREKCEGLNVPESYYASYGNTVSPCVSDDDGDDSRAGGFSDGDGYFSDAGYGSDFSM